MDENRHKPNRMRVAARHLMAKSFTLDVGDPVLFGKYKNKKGLIVGFGKDKKGNPLVFVDPIPKGRKQTKEIQLFRVWFDEARHAPEALL
jgi:hypothetical protein